MADILYDYEGKLYVNLTNECPCKCAFCIRDRKESVTETAKMWHDTTPTFAQIKEAIDSADLSGYDAAVFCGYGEPTCAFENLVLTAKYLKEAFGMKIRVNTNGLGNLINGRDITGELCAVADAVSISLNAPDKETYLKLTRSKFGIGSFDAMLEFTKKCVANGVDVRMTVVDVLTKEQIAQCAAIAEALGARFDARAYIK